VIRIEALQLKRLAAEALRRLDVANQVEVMDVRELTDGTWMVGFADHFPDTRFPGFEVAVQQEWSPEQAGRELRLELRDKLWICPLCQRRSQIRRVVDREVFRVTCDRCGRFEIESTLLDEFRLAYEAGDQSLVEHLLRLSQFTVRASGMPFLSAENWRALADAATR